MLRGINEDEPARAGVNHAAGESVGHVALQCKAGANDWSALTDVVWGMNAGGGGVSVCWV